MQFLLQKDPRNTINSINNYKNSSRKYNPCCWPWAFSNCLTNKAHACQWTRVHFISESNHWIYKIQSYVLILFQLTQLGAVEWPIAILTNLRIQQLKTSTDYNLASHSYANHLVDDVSRIPPLHFLPSNSDLLIKPKLAAFPSNFMGILAPGSFETTTVGM